MQQSAKVLEDSELKVARAARVPAGKDTVILPLDMLSPITKVFEITFYNFVKESIKEHGLYSPLVIHPITSEEWKKELELDKDQTPPDFNSNPLHYRIQCGCNRFYALQEEGYDAVECIVEEDLEAARNLCHLIRVDKRWQRGSNWEGLRDAV